jgi:hypothetical protein
VLFIFENRKLFEFMLLFILLSLLRYFTTVKIYLTLDFRYKTYISNLIGFDPILDRVYDQIYDITIVYFNDNELIHLL